MSWTLGAGVEPEAKSRLSRGPSQTCAGVHVDEFHGSWWLWWQWHCGDGDADGCCRPSSTSLRRETLIWRKSLKWSPSKFTFSPPFPLPEFKNQSPSNLNKYEPFLWQKGCKWCPTFPPHCLRFDQIFHFQWKFSTQIPTLSSIVCLSSRSNLELQRTEREVLMPSLNKEILLGRLEAKGV